MKGFGPWVFTRATGEKLAVIATAEHTFAFFHLTGEQKAFKPVDRLFKDDEDE